MHKLCRTPDDCVSNHQLKCDINIIAHKIRTYKWLERREREREREREIKIRKAEVGKDAKHKFWSIYRDVISL